jgi:hypothetical protein
VSARQVPRISRVHLLCATSVVHQEAVQLCSHLLPSHNSTFKETGPGGGVLGAGPT